MVLTHLGPWQTNGVLLGNDWGYPEPTYINNIQEHFDQLRQAIDICDRESIASCAHALKGVGRNLSLMRLSLIADQMESASRQNDVDVAVSHFEDLRIAIEEIISCFSQSDWIEKAKQCATS
ncbi:Hpt domain-containing protein [Planctomycetota bacterium]